MKVYKQRALEALSGKWGLAIGATLVYGIISSAASQFYGVGTILVAYPLLIGVSYFFMNLINYGESFDDLFEGFRDKYIENAITMLLMNVYLVLWSLLLIIPGIIKSFSYALVPYILADKKYNLTYNDAITESRQLMDGRKMELFGLYLSFFGWFLLCIPTFGIGLIWLMPYVNAAVAAYYLDVVGEYGKPEQKDAPFEQMQTKSAPVQKEEKDQDEWEF